jgi:hypothetical protein
MDMDLDPVADTDELNDYFSSSRQPYSPDPIAYWRGQPQSPLARMALDYLTAPGEYSHSYYSQYNMNLTHYSFICRC